MAPTLIPSLLAIAEDISHYSVTVCQQALSIIRHLLVMLASMVSTQQGIAELLEQQLPACIQRAGTIIAAPVTLSVSVTFQDLPRPLSVRHATGDLSSKSKRWLTGGLEIYIRAPSQASWQSA